MPGTSAADLLPQPAWSCGHAVGHSASELRWPGSFEASIHCDMLLGISGWLMLRLRHGASAAAVVLLRGVMWVFRKCARVTCLQTESDLRGHSLCIWYMMLLTVSCMRLDRPLGRQRCHMPGHRIATRRMLLGGIPHRKALPVSVRSPPPHSSEKVHDVCLV